MSRQDETLEAATTFLRSLAHGPTSSQRSSTSSSHSPLLYGNPIDPLSCKLPGASFAGKEEFEGELAALALRIQFLESRAEAVNQTLPDTPNESQLTSAFGEKGGDARNTPLDLARHNSSTQYTRHASTSHRSARVNTLLAARDSRPGVHERTVSEDDISYLRDHVQKQAEEIKFQRNTIAGISKGLQKSDEQAKMTLLKMENEDFGMLERELRKHQQANEAFQKALREIGGIITQVANGDLSMRVQIQASEMDAEIVTFKRTINTMMDQLEIFGSEVSRVAREVGTEGILGGQAQITGVHGIWKELTENGEF